MPALPDNTTLSYGSFTFPVTTETKVDIQPVMDSANRSLKYNSYTLTARCRFGGGTSSAANNLTLPGILRALVQEGQTLLYLNKGLGDLRINTGADANDVVWGPTPKMVSWVPLGNNACDFTWRVEFHLSNCANPNYGGILSLVFSQSFSHDTHGYTTRTYSGTLEIPRWKSVSGYPASFDRTPDSYLERVIPAVPDGYRLVNATHSVDESKTRLSFSVTHEEMTNPLPVGIVEASVSHSTQNTNPPALVQWSSTLSAGYTVAKGVPGVSSALAERLTGGRYVDVTINRDAAARFGMNIADVQSVISTAVGGENIGETVEGLQRFPINVRYPREIRDSLEKLRSLPIVSERGARLVLSDVADVRITDGPPMLRSENARLSGWVYVDIRGRDLRSAVQDMQRAVAQQVKLPPGYSISWSGQFEFLERATAKLKIVVPFTLLIIFVLLYLTFSRFDEALLIMATLPFALVGGIWLLYMLSYNLSVAGAVGFIALAGVSAEFGVIMLLYLKHAWQSRVEAGHTDNEHLLDAIRDGAVLRVRPKAMTVAVILAGLLPIMWGTGTGSEVMQRIAAPMVGGMITAPLLSMFVIPAAYLLMRRRREGKASGSVAIAR